MLESSRARNLDRWASVLGEQWLALYSRSDNKQDPLFVFRHAEDKQRVLIVRRDATWPAGREIDVPELGRMRCYDLLDDPALSAVRDILRRYQNYEVLRYRPGKRLTAAADDPVHGPVIVKCIAKGIDGALQRLHALWRVRSELEFSVSRPHATIQSESVFIQERLSGYELRFEPQDEAVGLARRMAVALISLHRSTALFESTFDLVDQTRRSKRYGATIKEKFPSLSSPVDVLTDALQALGQTIETAPRPLVPIHGSPHSHQWLVHGDELALVDFDRAAMGHAELDIATFLAEWDYEPGPVSQAIKQEFVSAFPDHDESLLKFYRAHKHLAKAFKAAKDVDAVNARTKCRRNLENASALLV